MQSDKAPDKAPLAPPPDVWCWRRVNVVGTSGSGKSAFSWRLATALQVDYIEMDALNWQPGWQEASRADFDAKLAAAIAADAWVLDGNYSRTNALKWSRTEVVVWLDYGFWRTFSQILKRSLRRAASGKEIWVGTGNRETFYRTFCTRESVVWWMLTNYRSNRKRYTALLHADGPNNPYAHMAIVQLRSHRQANDFIERCRIERYRSVGQV